MVFLVSVSPGGAELEDGIEVGGWATEDVPLVAGGWVKFAGMELCGGPLEQLFGAFFGPAFGAFLGPALESAVGHPLDQLLEHLLDHLFLPAFDLPLEQ